MGSAGVMVLGAGGMLGSAVVAAGASRERRVVGLTRSDLDITDSESLRRRVAEERPGVVVNCAAYTQVDACEEHEDEATEVNGHAAGRAAAICDAAQARFVHVSTDYVFDGAATRPYEVEHPTAPIQAYGRSKLVGEQAVLGAAETLVVRTSWLFGAGGPNFVDTMLRLAGERPALQVVADQIGCPTYTPFLAEALLDLAEDECWLGLRHGRVAHYANPEPVSWHAFAEAIMAAAGLSVVVEAVGSDALQRPARRPAYSVLSTTATAAVLGRPVRPWRDGLARYLELREAS